jgi:uncharacterized repeat protein (TIGR02543 family)
MRFSGYLFGLLGVVLLCAGCTPLEGDIESLRAEAGLNSYTVTFNANGGTPVPGKQSVRNGGKALEPQGVAKTGHILDGWYQEGASSNRWSFTVNTVTKNITLYAKWVETGAKYTVTFASNGGSTVAPQTVTEGEQAVRPAEDPTRAGWGPSATGTATPA